MLEILGYMVAAYGIARLWQTTSKADTSGRLAGIFGITALVVLTFLLHEQASQVGSGLGL